MVGSIGSCGSLGTEAAVQMQRFMQTSNNPNNYMGTLFMLGINAENSLQRVENHIEGNDAFGNNVNGDLVNSGRMVQNNSSAYNYLTQGMGQNSGLFVNMDLFKNTYSIQNESQTASQLGLSWDPQNGKTYSTLNIGFNNVAANAYQNAPGVASGMESVNLNSFGSQWKNSSYTLSNIDLNSVGNDYTSTMGYYDLMYSMNQWASPFDIAAYNESNDKYNMSLQMIQNSGVLFRMP